MALRKGWLKREFAAVEREVANWPRWMRSQANDEEERIFLAQPHYGSVPHAVMGIIAFTPREAREKMLQFCLERIKGSWQRLWSMRGLRMLPNIDGISAYKAAEVLIHAGIEVLHIEEERAGRACPIRVMPVPRSPRTIRRKIK